MIFILENASDMRQGEASDVVHTRITYNKLTLPRQNGACSLFSNILASPLESKTFARILTLDVFPWWKQPICRTVNSDGVELSRSPRNFHLSRVDCTISDESERVNHGPPAFVPRYLSIALASRTQRDPVFFRVRKP
jgi:hypothetical protein